MPKVYLDEKSRIKARFTRWLAGEMKLNGTSQKTIAEHLGISQQMFSYKLKKQDFDYVEFVLIMRFFDAEQEEMISLIRKG